MAGLLAACGGEEAAAPPAPTAKPAAPAAPAATAAPAAPAAPAATAKPAPTAPPAVTAAPVATATAAPVPSGPTPAPAGSQYGGTLNFAYFRAPTPPDGYQSSGGFEGFFIYTNNDSILGRGVGTTVNVAESLATSWEVLDNGLRVRLRVRKGVQFQGGLGEMTTEDVAWSFNRWFEPGAAGCGGCSGVMRAVKKVEVVDKDIVDISMSRLDANIIIKLTGREAIIHSKKHWTAIGGADAHKSKAIGTGPYKLVEWQPGTSIKYERHNDWWGGKPFADFVNVITISETRTRLAALQTGQANVAFLQSEMIPAARKNPNIDVWAGDFGREGWNWTVVLPPLNDIRVRRALVKAIDRDALNASVYLDTMYMSKTTCGLPFPPQTSDCKDLWQTDWFGYDVEAAKKLIQGYAKEKGLSLPLTLKGAVERRPDRQQLNEFLQGAWREIGVNYTFETTANVSASSDLQEPCTEVAHVSTGTPLIELRLLEGTFSQITSVKIANCKKLGKFLSPEDQAVQDKIEALLLEASTTIDDEKRNALYKQVDYLSTKYVFETFALMNRQNFFGCNNTITGGCGNEKKSIDINRGDGFFRQSDFWVRK
jgi:ABC-type transport system substrate-binding protein